MTRRYRYFYGWQGNKDPLMVFAMLLLALFTRPSSASAQTKDSSLVALSEVKPQPHLSFQLSSGLGYAPAKGGNVLWDVQFMLGTPVFGSDGMVWIGIVPTMVPQSIGDESAVDGFTPFVVEYEYDFRASFSIPSTATPFLYANAGAGPQFGDRSNHSLLQAVMCSAGAGIRSGTGSGFFGQLGITYNNVSSMSSPVFLILNAGIFF
jgi:hypothetical protein